MRRYVVHLCPRCEAILPPEPEFDAAGRPQCRTCLRVFQPTDAWPAERFNEWVGKRWNREHVVTIGPSREHNLNYANKLLDPEDYVPGWMAPIDALFYQLADAEHFVHFTSWGLSQQLFGALRLLGARGVWVRGIVGGAAQSLVEELGRVEELDGLDRVVLKAYPFEASQGLPHSKMLVVDGVVALMGSANMTLTGWRKAATGNEHVQAVTDLEQVRKLHNLYFSRPWGRLREPPTEPLPMVGHWGIHDESP